MSKSAKNKKSKVPKLTEAEYAEYISTLRAASETPSAVETEGKSDEEGTE